VFGIDNDMTPARPRPAAAGPYDQGMLSGIVKRYPTPAFQVAVYEVTSVGAKTSHPVVWIPPHEAIPVCSARGGSEIDGKPAGIVRGTHYTRGLAWVRNRWRSRGRNSGHPLFAVAYVTKGRRCLRVANRCFAHRDTPGPSRITRIGAGMKPAIGDFLRSRVARARAKRWVKISN